MARSRSRRSDRPPRAKATGNVAGAARPAPAAPARRRLSQLVPFLVFGLMLFARCGPRATQAGGQPSDMQHVSIEMRESGFAPEIVTVRAKHPVDVTVRNTGAAPHEWVVEGLDQPVRVAVQPGESGGARFTPARVGTYRIVVAEPGLEEIDGVGQLVVH